MVSKCANPNCAAGFRYFHIGKLFRMETSPGLERRRSMGQEGMSNLARAFLSSGATAVLATAWSVSDTASSSLLTEFYRNLVGGKEVATALRDPKLTLLQRFGPSVLPTVAAFQVIGNGDVIIPFGQNRTTLKGAQP